MMNQYDLAHSKGSESLTFRVVVLQTNRFEPISMTLTPLILTPLILSVSLEAGYLHLTGLLQKLNEKELLPGIEVQEQVPLCQISFRL